MAKFSYEIYDLLYSGSKFTLKHHDGTLVETRLVVAGHKPQLIYENEYTNRKNWACYDLSDGDEIFGCELYKSHLCFKCFKPATKYIGLEFFCDHHYDDYCTILKYKIRDNMYFLNNIGEYNLFDDYYGIYIVNEQDLNFPCVVAVHDDTESGSFGYIVSKNMLERGQINDMPV